MAHAEHPTRHPEYRWIEKRRECARKRGLDLDTMGLRHQLRACDALAEQRLHHGLMHAGNRARLLPDGHDHQIWPHFRA